MLVAIVAPILSSGSSNITYFVEKLGEIPTAGPAFGRKINDSGVVVGTASTPGGGGMIQVAFTWDRTNGLRALPNYEPTNYPGGSDINSSGQMVGSSPFGCFWNGFAAPIQLQRYEDRAVHAHALNDAAKIVGSMGWINFGMKAVYYPSPKSAPIRLDNLPDDVKTLPFGINSQGQIVIHTPNSGFVGGPPATYVWTNGSLETLPIGTTIDRLNGWDINDNEWVVGDAFGSFFKKPFLWRRSLGTIELPMPSGFEEGMAYGVNNQNMIVGQIRGTTGHYAVLWEKELPINLQTQIDESSAAWHLIRAWDINSSGWIVGDGFFQSTNRGFLARPVVFENLPPSQFTVLQGNVFSGGISSLVSDDGDFLRIAENPARSRTTPPVELVLESNVSTEPIDIFQFKVRSLVSTPGLSLDIYFFDWAQSQFVLQQSQAAQTSENSVYLTRADWSRYVSSTGQVRSKVVYRVTGTLAARATASMDQICWRVVRL